MVQHKQDDDERKRAHKLFCMIIFARQAASRT
jgi:hypothetical protein